MQKLIFFIIMVSCTLLEIVNADAQNIFTIDAANAVAYTPTVINLGNAGLPGKEIKINDRYMTIGGKAVIPVMGELHFARVPKANWEDAILKMKANGVTIISTYIFWIHHEEIEGQFDWKDNKDLRAFAQLCAKHGMYVYPRIGPWCHGESRNGGIPDWLLLKKNIKMRTNDRQYQQYVDLWYQQIGRQLQGLMYKDGGPVISVQLENEYVEGKTGEAHILWLKQTAIKYGMDVPLYTVTGWGNASVPNKEVIPLFGAYPDEPWADHLERTTSCNNFTFSPVRNDDKIGSALQQSEQHINLSDYPYFTCETGMGIDNTTHRRLIVGALDGYGLVSAKLGSGSNLIGYYMFAGGLNPAGALTSMEENKLETGSYSDNPAVRYDFQAAIGASGALAPSYQELKKLHYFLGEFGSLLAPMEPVFVTTNSDLQLALRVKDNQAFLFGINYCRHNTKSTLNDAQFTVKFANETVTFPSHPITISDTSMFIWPINFSMENTMLKYATAQPLCALHSNGFNQWIFIENTDYAPEFCFDASTIKNLTSSTGTIVKTGGKYIVSDIKPGYKAVISITPKSGLPQRIIILSESEGRQAWLLKNENKKYFFISNANMYLKEDKLHLYSTDETIFIKTLGNGSLLPNGKLNIQTHKDGLFTNYNYSIAPQKLNLVYTKQNLLQNAAWLMLNNPEKLDRNQLLLHHFFSKDFSYNQLSKIKSAKLFIAAQTACTIQVNGVWVNQKISANQLSVTDLTGYIQQGENKLLLAFPFEENKKAFAAKLLITSYNNNEVELLTDSSWQTKDDYTFPSVLTGGYPDKKPQTTSILIGMNTAFQDYQEYTISVPDYSVNNFSNVYMNIRYNGDKARLFFDECLMEDNFNNNTNWTIGLNRFDNLQGKQLKLQLFPLAKDARIYFDAPDSANEQAAVKDINLVPEYQWNFNIKDALH